MQALQLSQILNANEEQTHRLRQLMRALQIEDEVRPARRRREGCRRCAVRLMYKGGCTVCEPTNSAQCVCFELLVHASALCLCQWQQDIAIALAIANSLRDQTRMEGELAELEQVC